MTNFSRNLPTIMIFLKCNIEKQRRGKKKKREKMGKWEAYPGFAFAGLEWVGSLVLYT